MYAWYKQSAICYAYLADVGEGEGKGSPSERKEDEEISSHARLFGTQYEEEIKRSKWFTRAWTLQELLAPEARRMRFFSGQWASLGSKLDLTDIISPTTGIAEEYLTGMNALDSASISMRMSWAADRRATRAEDIAYSLLGIFDVNMPLLYGEGKFKAFWRLQEEIMKVSEDETLFAWERDEMTSSQVENNGSEANLFSALASDPQDFRSARDFIPYVSDDPVEPYALTPRGLRIQLQICPYPGESRIWGSYPHHSISLGPAAAVLRCHIAHDFENVVAIRLNPITATQYTRYPNRKIGLLPARYLSEFPPVREVYIKHGRFTSMDESVSRKLGFLIRTLPHGMKIVRSFPDGTWNSKDRILTAGSDPPWAFSWKSRLELRTDHTSSPLPPDRSIFLTLGWRNRLWGYEWKAWGHLDDILWREGKPTLKDYDGVSPKQSRLKVHRFYERDSVYETPLRVRIAKERVLGQPMFVVDIEFVPKNESNRRWTRLFSRSR